MHRTTPNPQTVSKEKDKTKGAKAEIKLLIETVTIECQHGRKLITLWSHNRFMVMILKLKFQQPPAVWPASRWELKPHWYSKKCKWRTLRFQFLLIRYNKEYLT